jgi:predicted molibdopterin-dependent oxidoreductase YjgC
MGITQHTTGVDNVMSCANLAMLTGNLGRESTGVNPLRGQNNVQGACDMGALPDYLTGYQSLNDASVKTKFETAWGCSLSSNKGLSFTEIMEAARKKQIKAVYIIGENLVLGELDSDQVREALGTLEFLAVQDIFLTETAKLAHVVLPAVSFAEKEGTFTNTERRIQPIKKAVDSVGDARPDWWITCQIAKKAGKKGFDFEDPSKIMKEIFTLTPIYGGITYSRLESGSLQWPCPDYSSQGTAFLYKDKFTGQFIPLEYKPLLKLTNAAYPLLLTLGRSLYASQTGTLSRKVSGLNTLRKEEMVEINPEDALAAGISDGDKVKVISPQGVVIVKA